MNQFLCRFVQRALHLSPDLVHSRLFDDTTFYHQFMNDLKHCKHEVIIESPYISSHRMYSFTRLFESLVARKVKVYVITRDPDEHDLTMKMQAEAEIRRFEALGVQVLLCTGNHHRKLAILDRRVLWEGSLNILSQVKIREIMRRIDSQELATEMFNFLKFGNFL
jgi:phosphatidylserine/phosphatidylglycerophosphate/cardiolipin synthase-like enzyme